MKTIVKIVIILFMLSASVIANASDTTNVKLSVGADLVSHYVWRGMMLSNSPSIQPSMSVSYNGLSLGSWASYSVNSAAFQEVDLYLTYSHESLTIGVNDYYNPIDSIGVNDRYFYYGKKISLHSIEPFITVSNIGGTPISATGAFFVYGNDRDDNGKNLFSSYVELSYFTNLYDYGLAIFGGATLNKGYYAEKPAIVNLGISLSKELNISEGFSVPLKGSFIVNPNTQNVYLVLGLSF